MWWRAAASLAEKQNWPFVFVCVWEFICPSSVYRDLLNWSYTCSCKHVDPLGCMLHKARPSAAAPAAFHHRFTCNLATKEVSWYPTSLWKRLVVVFRHTGLGERLGHWHKFILFVQSLLFFVWQLVKSVKKKKTSMQVQKRGKENAVHE